MPHVRGQQEYLAFPDGNIHGLSVLLGLEEDVACELVKKFLVRVVVIIVARVGAAHHHDDEVGVPVDHGIAHRRLEQVAVLVDPVPEIDRGKGHMRFLPIGISDGARRATFRGQDQAEVRPA